MKAISPLSIPRFNLTHEWGLGWKVSGRLKIEGLGSGMLKVFETMTFGRPLQTLWIISSEPFSKILCQIVISSQRWLGVVSAQETSGP